MLDWGQRPGFGRQVVLLCGALSLFVLSGCTDQPGPSRPAANDHSTTGASSRSVTTSPGSSSTAPTVAPLASRSSADLLVRSDRSMSAELRKKINGADGVNRTLSFASGTTTLNGTKVTIAAVDPSTFRAYAPTGTAESDPLWASIARGEMAVMHTRADKLRLTLGGQADLAGGDRRVGAFATTLPGVDVVVDEAVGESLGLRDDTGLVASVGDADPGSVGQRLNKLVGKHADVDLLSAPKAVPQSFLTGSDAAKAFGTFSYRYSANGTISPDPDWVRANIRSERVPILGTVTCHRLMLPQLRGALEEVVEAGLASKIHADEYAGCYVPRFIESNPDRPISLHTWGIALDVNVPGNQRGTKGEMDRKVVAIFKKWGFAWGGDWSYTDPMHFELAALMKNPPE